MMRLSRLDQLEQARKDRRYRRNKLNGKIHLKGSGCKHAFGRWTEEWKDGESKSPMEIINLLFDQGAFDWNKSFRPFCYFCFGRGPNIEIFNRLHPRSSRGY